MTKRRPVESYSDCFALFDLCLSNNGIRVPLANGKAAIALRHRLYRARVRFVDSTQNPKYNDIFLQIIYENGDIQTPGNILHPDMPCAIVMQLHSSRPLPQVTDLEGNPLTTPANATEAVASDDLLEAALAFKNKLVE